NLHIPALSPFKALLNLVQDVVPAELKGKDIGEWLRQKRSKVITEVWKKMMLDNGRKSDSIGFGGDKE
ncbi:hypothetical protein NL518_30055, partial [Klebsiella pneumoniae]|nr:hypothetical protein [Klebsiella pneumoniae]